ncbi:hypothetical protein I0Q12_26555, partial [Rhodococcus sp. CX]|nr:hypothetical protein [Rhodococcus sp. CX]
MGAGARGLLAVSAAALVAGIAIGFVGGAFRWCLGIADRWRFELLEWAGRAHGKQSPSAGAHDR